ncbi:MAG: hypothetical protein AAGF83_27660 [Cyanobacteria bacterium P01_G01_bin.67]
MNENIKQHIIPILDIAEKKIEASYPMWNYQLILDTEISEELSLDIDIVRSCLEEMQTLDLIEIKKIQEGQKTINTIKEITSMGKMILKKALSLSEVINNNQTLPLNNYHYQFNHYGSGDNIARDKNINSIHESPELSQLIKDIQAVLKKLEQTYNPNTTTGKMTIATKAIEHIEQDSNLTKRVRSALEKGGVAWLQAKIINPSASFLVAALEDWQKDKQ